MDVIFEGQNGDLSASTSPLVSPALREQDAEVVALDPWYSHEAEKLLLGVKLSGSARDVAVTLTGLVNFESHDFKSISATTAPAVLVDPRNLLSAGHNEKICFKRYISLRR